MRRFLLVLLALWSGAAWAVDVPFQLGDANQVLPNNAFFVATNVPLTAPRTVTLSRTDRTCVSNVQFDPLCPADVLVIIDAGGINGANTLSVVPAAGETINGSATPVLMTPGSTMTLRPLPGNNWRMGVVGTGNDVTANCRWFGALGDGVNDDTAAINACIAYAHSLPIAFLRGVKIYLPSGVYNISDTINMTGWSQLSLPGGDDGPAVTLDGYGAALRATAFFVNGHHMLDMLSSFGLRINGLTVFAACNAGAIPDIGIAFGRASATPVNGALMAVGAGLHTFNDVNVYGCYSLAGMYDRASEQDLFVNVDIKTSTTGTASNVSGPYGMIMDGLNHWGVTSNLVQLFQPATGPLGVATVTTPGTGYNGGGTGTFAGIPLVTQTGSGSGCSATVVVTAGVISSVTPGNACGTGYAIGNAFTVGTVGAAGGTGFVGTVSFLYGGYYPPPLNVHMSFISTTFIAGNLIAYVGGTARPLWISTEAEQVSFLNTYLNHGTDTCVDVYSEANATGGFATMANWEFKWNCESSTGASQFLLGGTLTTPVFHGLSLKLLGAGVANNKSLFAIDPGSAIATVNFQNFDVTLERLVAGGLGVTVFDAPNIAKYSITGGKFYSASAASVWNLPPAQFEGCLNVAGVYSCNAPVMAAPLFSNLPTCNAANQGSRFFITDSNSVIYHATAAGLGANKVGVLCDGTNWYVN